MWVKEKVTLMMTTTYDNWK